MDKNQVTDNDLESPVAQNQAGESPNQDSPETFDTLTGTDNTDLAKELSKTKDELAEAKDKYLRLYSEFENFRRRTAKEKLELIQSANEATIKLFLPVMDDFERAEKSFQGSNPKDLEGLQLISNKFRKLLEQSGVKPMDLPAGSEFNPDLHDAITQVPVNDDSLKGRIVDVVEKGYFLNDKVIRHAKVVVGQ
ncbi:MAG: nucleotide exchange factor GrpE [Flammeovirgaceae bacterium]|nr:MAG: nucleotide exchange factor GrpE [Flammeovirgaceae bacterium]